MSHKQEKKKRQESRRRPVTLRLDWSGETPPACEFCGGPSDGWILYQDRYRRRCTACCRQIVQAIGRGALWFTPLEPMQKIVLFPNDMKAGS